MGKFKQPRWRSPSIQTKLFGALFVIALLPALVINWYYYERTNVSLEQKIRSYNEELLKQLSDKVGFVSEQVKTTETQLIAYSVTSRAFVDYSEKTGAEKLDTLKKTEELLANFKRSYPYITEIYMVGSDGTIYSTDPYLNRDKLTAMPWVEEALRTPTGRAEGELLLSHTPSYTLLQEREVLSFVRPVGAYGTRRDLALIQIDVDAAKFGSLLQLMPTDQTESVFLMDKRGRIIQERTSAELSDTAAADIRKRVAGNAGIATTTAKSDGQTLMLSVRPLEGREWIMAVASPLSRYSLDFRHLRNILLIVAALALVVAVLFAILLSHGILRQFHTLIRSMRKAGEGQLNVKVPVSNSPDIGMVAVTFNTMVEKIDQLLKDSVKKEEEKTAAELKALQAQIQPHFLYNTLNSIKWMAISEGADKIADAVVALVKVLRFTYRTNEIFLPIKDELEFIRDYVKVQRMRFGEKIEVEYEWDKRIERYYTLKFIIQPIVENAMIHGLANKSYNGLIIVRGVLDEANRQIRFEIEDNGVGFAPKRKDQMSGVGMSNVNDRIRMHFGEQYGLTVEKPLRLHTRIVITIPILTEGKVV
ncbi:sensor histidine kinase [Cohnella sp.]|uniref:cache domain-containing sensor histidine kinase n=1 Tax=Cohnella sp. TaxID=1883426 RepID=UPI003703A152